MLVAPVDDLEQLTRRFVDFAQTARGRAPLYAMLSTRLADEPERLRPLMVAVAEQRTPVLFFAAIHLSLLNQPDHPLATHYATLGGRSPRDQVESDVAWVDFVDLVRRRRVDIESTIRDRRIQTNEIGRCALFRPAIATLPSQQPIRLIELGAAAGLNLALDQYRIRYSSGGEQGPTSDVVLECELRGEQPLFEPIAAITERIGFDDAPLDLESAHDRMWLRACIWSDEPERLERLNRAIEITSAQSVTLHRRDLRIDPLAILREAVPASEGTTPVIITSWTLAYLDDDAQRGVIAAIDQVGREHHDLIWVSFEHLQAVPALGEMSPEVPADERASTLQLSHWESGERTTHQLARCHPHGHWMQWSSRH